MGSRPCCLACQAIPTRYFFISASFTCNKKYPAYPSLCLKEEMISRKKTLRIKANHAYWIQFSPAEKLLLSLHRSLFPHFFRSSFSRSSTNFWLLPPAKNAASLRWNENESLRFLIRFQATKQANLERPGRSYIRCQNSLFRTFFFSLLDECMTAWFPISFNVDSRLKLLFPALVVQWNRCEDSFDDYLHILFS